MTLSVVMPNYNHGRFLKKSVAAIVEQSLPPDELLIIDDASTDNSWEILQELAAKHPIISLHRNKTNQGIIPNMNLGLKLAHSDYLLFSAADDALMPGFIEKSLSLLGAHREAGLSCTITTMRDGDLEWQLGCGMADRPTYFSPTELMELERRKKVLIASNSVIFRRACLIEAGGFRPELKWHTDTFVVHAVAFRYGICHIPEVLAHVNVEPNSYFQAGRRNEVAHREVCERIMALLTSPAFEKEGELMSRAGTFYRFEGCILSVLWRNPRYRRLITWPFLRKHLWYSLQVKLKPYTPAFIGNLYLKLVGYHTKTAK